LHLGRLSRGQCHPRGQIQVALNLRLDGYSPRFSQTCSPGGRVRLVLVCRGILLLAPLNYQQGLEVPVWALFPARVAMVISPERLMTGDCTEMRLHSQPDRVISPKGLMTGIRTGMRLPGQTVLFPLRRDQGQTNVLRGPTTFGSGSFGFRSTNFRAHVVSRSHLTPRG
jgi:hypothetical protein